jgi:hypothetical protein
VLYSNGNEPGQRLNLVHDRRLKPITNINGLKTIEQLEQFLAGNQAVDFLVDRNKPESWAYSAAWLSSGITPR